MSVQLHRLLLLTSKSLPNTVLVRASLSSLPAGTAGICCCWGFSFVLLELSGTEGSAAMDSIASAADTMV